MGERPYPYNVLVVTEQTGEYGQLAETLPKEYAVWLAHTAGEAAHKLAEEDIAVVIAEQRMLESVGVGVLEKTAATHPAPLWILIAEETDPQGFSQAIRNGHLYHYLPKPFNLNVLTMLVRRALEHYHLTVEHAKLSEQFQALQAQHRAERRETLIQTIQTDKMVTLGQLVAGIAHEMNSPTGAISAAVGNLSHHLTQLVDRFRMFEEQNMTSSDVQRLIRLVAAMLPALEGASRKHSHEVRLEQKRVAAMLEAQGVHAYPKLAKSAAQMGLTEQLDELLDFAEHYDIDNILAFLSHWNRIMTSTSDIRLSVEFLTRIIRALKSYSYPRQETPEIANIHESIESALTILQSKLKHQIRVTCQYGEVPQISCYATELIHVWINLIQNAVQAIKGEGEITIKTFATQAYLGVRITDTGAGIPAEIQRRIFDANFTTKAQGEGTGLGLAIVRQIIEKHGGTVEVMSIPGQTMFEVRLPFNQRLHL